MKILFWTTSCPSCRSNDPSGRSRGPKMTLQGALPRYENNFLGCRNGEPPNSSRNKYPMNQCINPSIKQSSNPSIKRSNNQSAKQTINQTINKMINPSINQSTNSRNQSNNQSINPSINQSINQSTN